MKRALRCLVASVTLLAPGPAGAQDPAPPAPQPEARSTGLPSKLQWTFNFDAGWGSFGFANSLYKNPKDPGVDENLSDQWFEGYVKPALSGSYTLASSSEIYGKVSAVGERTYGSVPAEFGSDVSSFGPEDLYIGWRSGKSLDIGENALDFRIGRSQYRLGNGMLLFDGASEGGSRGGYWTNARKAFEFAAIGRFTGGPHTAEGFYLDKDELPESDSGTRLWGANYELSVGELSTFGATYMKFYADEAIDPGRNGLNVFNLRAYTAPVPSLPDLSFEVEYALEDNGDALDSNAWTFQAAYELSDVTWKPRLSYRYAAFEGDDPATAANEAFDPLLLGFNDWGQWWQGEIAGEYFLSNSNLISHTFRVHVTPNDAIGTGLLFYQFNLDQPASFAPGVTAKDLAFEVDWYMDWRINENFTASFLGAYADPGKAVQQAFDRTKNFTYGMIYVGYSF
jgi:Alginate export